MKYGYEEDFQTSSPILASKTHRMYVATWTLIAINLILWIATELVGDSENPKTLIDFGALFGPFIANGEYWRLFTAMFLHVGLIHLLFNVFALFIFGQIVERAFGQIKFIVIYISSGLTGSIFSFSFNPISIGAGASGAIFGILGALVAYFLMNRQKYGVLGQQNLTGVVVISSINLLLGFITPGIDNWAHIGGFSSGLLIGLVLTPKYEAINKSYLYTEQETDINTLVKRWWIIPIITIVLFICTWLGIENIPDNAQSRIHSAEQHLKQNNLRKALTDIQKALELNPSLGKAYYIHGLILRSLGNEDKSRGEFFKAIAIAEHNGDNQTVKEARETLMSSDTKR